MTAFGDFGTLLRLVFGKAAATVAAYLDALAPGAGGGRPGEDAALRAALAAERCRREIARARTGREHLVAEILRHDKAREILIERLEAATDEAGKQSLRRSLKTLEDRLTGWLDEHDALNAEIAALEADLAFFDAAGGRGEEPPRPAGPAIDAETAGHLAALGLAAPPGTLADLKTAYRTRLKAVHPDVGARPSTEDAARATVAFAELRKRYSDVTPGSAARSP